MFKENFQGLICIIIQFIHAVIILSQTTTKSLIMTLSQTTMYKIKGNFMSLLFDRKNVIELSECLMNPT